MKDLIFKLHMSMCSQCPGYRTCKEECTRCPEFLEELDKLVITNFKTLLVDKYGFDLCTHKITYNRENFLLSIIETSSYIDVYVYDYTGSLCFGYISVDSDFIDTLESWLDKLSKGFYRCSKCGKWLTKDEYRISGFAGVVCKQCPCESFDTSGD